MEGANKREAMMQAALELVGEHGFHGSPMALIAARAGVASGTIYHYFENRDVLIRETYACMEHRLLESMSETYPAERPARERFLHILRTLVGYFLASPMEFRFAEQFHNSPYGVACRRDRFSGKNKDFISKLFEEARDQQVIKNLPLPMLFALTFGALVDICRCHVLEFITLDDQLIEEMVEACWDAVKR